MTDLVQRLRQFRRTPIFAPVHEAADRIERQDVAIRQLREALDELMEWQVKNVKKWHNPAYDNAHKALAATEEWK